MSLKYCGVTPVEMKSEICFQKTLYTLFKFFVVVWVFWAGLKLNLDDAWEPSLARPLPSQYTIARAHRFRVPAAQSKVKQLSLHSTQFANLANRDRSRWAAISGLESMNSFFTARRAFSSLYFIVHCTYVINPPTIGCGFRAFSRPPTPPPPGFQNREYCLLVLRSMWCD